MKIKGTSVYSLKLISDLSERMRQASPAVNHEGGGVVAKQITSLSARMSPSVRTSALIVGGD